jgi:hypothetical protein
MYRALEITDSAPFSSDYMPPLPFNFNIRPSTRSLRLQCSGKMSCKVVQGYFWQGVSEKRDPSPLRSLEEIVDVVFVAEPRWLIATDKMRGNFSFSRDWCSPFIGYSIFDTYVSKLTDSLHLDRNRVLLRSTTHPLTVYWYEWLTKWSDHVASGDLPYIRGQWVGLASTAKPGVREGPPVCRCML